VNEIVASFQKNKYEEVRFQIKEYKGKDLIDIRIWTDVKGADQKIPTTKGVTMNISHFPDLKKGLLELERVLKVHKLLTPENPTEDVDGGTTPNIDIAH
jgi:hypothetical protein